MLNKISIITPSYNHGEFIEDAILSVKNQKKVNIEHIIIDGGSKDNTKNILKKYRHLKWISKKNRGQTHALNIGLKLATGNIIGWLNADDYYSHNIFKKIINKLEDDNIDFTYGDYQYVTKNKKKIRKRISKKYFLISKKIVSRFICFIPSTTFFIKKDKLKNIKFDEKIKFTMDKEFFANLLNKNLKVNKIDLLISNNRIHENNRLESRTDSNLEKIRFKEGIYIFNKFSKKKIPKNNFGILVYKFIQKTLIFINFILNIFVK